MSIPVGFRTSFSFSNRIFWYPQHQQRAWNQLEKGIHHIDFVVEVRDARIPLTCIRTFEGMQRDRLVVYNKCDLANPQLFQTLAKELLANREEKVIFTKADTGLNIKKILEVAIEKCKSDPVRFPYLSIVVVGAPNVGKSTLINGLRKLGVGKGKVTQVGKKAGVTTAIQTRVKINMEPPIYLFDTPGIFNPHVTTPIQGLKIALTGATSDNLTSISNVADYLLYRLNNSAHLNTWPLALGLKEPTDSIDELSLYIAQREGFKLNEHSRMVRLLPKSNKYWDTEKACQYFVDLYREGKFGKMTLDDLKPDALKTFFLGDIGQQQMKFSSQGYGYEPETIKKQ